MSKTKQTPKKETQKASLRGLFGTILDTLGTEVEKLPELLQTLPPDKRLDWISRNLTLLLKYREMENRDDGLSWDFRFGE